MNFVGPVNIGISRYVGLSKRGIQWMKGSRTGYGFILTVG
jgi:hypothetical protein